MRALVACIGHPLRKNVGFRLLGLNAFLDAEWVLPLWMAEYHILDPFVFLLAGSVHRCYSHKSMKGAQVARIAIHGNQPAGLWRRRSRAVRLLTLCVVCAGVSTAQPVVVDGNLNDRLW